MPETRICAHCGSSFEVRYASSQQKNCSASCGAHASKNKKHGRSFTPVYNAWRDMKQRCLKSYHPCYERYGGRGIKICERWMSFDNFLADMGEKPSPKHSIERIDNDGNYEPDNCKWATKVEQTRNRSCSYTAEEDRKIRDGAGRGLTYKQIAATLPGRTKLSVQIRAKRLGVKLGRAHLPGFYASKGGFAHYVRTIRGSFRGLKSTPQ